MSQIEREIKILNVDIDKILQKMRDLGVEPKGKYIQDVYTFDFPKLQDSYKKNIEILRNTGDNRGLISIIREARVCFSKEDVEEIEEIIGQRDLVKYIEVNGDSSVLDNKQLIDLMSRANEIFFKWIRLRQTGDETTITIKKVVDGKGEYDLDAVEELEFGVPNIVIGKSFLENMGYFPARHQKKMRIAYDYENTEVVIDKWPKIPPYIEVEGKTKEEIYHVVNALGFKPEDVKIINTDDVYSLNGLDLYSFKDLDFSDVELEMIGKYISTEEKK